MNEPSVHASSLGHLECLSGHLRAHSWRATLVIPSEGRPYVHISNPAMRALNENVLAAPDSAGSWWFWWPWNERIAPITDICHVLARIGHVLAIGEG